MSSKNAKAATYLPEFENLEKAQPSTCTLPANRRHEEPRPVRIAGPWDNTGLAIVRLLVWIACVAWTALVILYWLLKQTSEDSAIRDAAHSASACLGIVAAYVICRAFDSATRR